MKDGLSATEEMPRRRKTQYSVHLKSKQNLEEIQKNILQTKKPVIKVSSYVGLQELRRDSVSQRNHPQRKISVVFAS